MKKILQIILFGIAMIYPLAAQAQQLSLCPALAEEASYKDNDSYKTLMEGKNGWIFRTKSDFVDNFQMNSALRQRFERLHKAFQDQNMQLVIALLPTRGMVHFDQYDQTAFDRTKALGSYEELTKKLEEIGIPTAHIKDFSKPQDFYYKRDHHWNAAGAKTMAQNVAQKVKALDVYKDIPKKNFVTEKADIEDYPGTFSRFVKDICGTDIPVEQAQLYKTFSKDDDLFGDTKTADIILIGTSNSAQTASKANFDGFLKEFIGADIDNLSVSGGGVDTALLDWLTSESYESHKPKIVIWEIPVYQNFKGEPLYRQAIPAVYGSCEGRAVFTKTAPITGETFDVDVSALGKSAKGHYMHLQFSDFRDRKFRMTTTYQDNSKEPFDIRRSKFFESTGEYFLEFKQDDDKALKSITGLMPKGTAGSVTLSFCAYP